MSALRRACPLTCGACVVCVMCVQCRVGHVGPGVVRDMRVLRRGAVCVGWGPVCPVPCVVCVL